MTGLWINFQINTKENMHLTNKEIVSFFRKIKNLNLTKKEKSRMYRLFQVRGSNKVNKVMSYEDFKIHLKNKNGKMTKLVLGPSWSRLVFVDINVEI